MIRAIAVSLALVLPFAAQAQQRAPVQLNFAVYMGGLNVLDITSAVDLNAGGYQVALSYRTVGLFGLVFHSEAHSLAQGRWDGPGLVPLRFASSGTARGVPRRTVIDYVRGQPLVRALEPPEEPDHEPVPVAMQRDTIDTLSAMVLLVRQVATTGRCDGHTATFDGRRVVDIASRTVGEEALPSDGRSGIGGAALRCDLEWRQLAGFQRGAGGEELHKIQHSSAWLAPLWSGGPKLPVRVEFETRFFGHGTAYLTDTVSGEASAANAVQ